MAEETTATAERKSTKEAPGQVDKRAATQTAVFLSRSGYDAADVEGHNEKTRVFVTSNGGKYVLTKDSIRTISGPEYPKAVEEAEEEATPKSRTEEA
jgi:hypothetical protein